MGGLYFSAYWVLRGGSNSPNKRNRRNEAQSTQPAGPPAPGQGVVGVWLMMPLNGLGEKGPVAGSLDCGRNGRLKLGKLTNELPPKGGSALNCSSTSCSIGL